MAQVVWLGTKYTLCSVGVALLKVNFEVTKKITDEHFSPFWRIAGRKACLSALATARLF